MNLQKDEILCMFLTKDLSHLQSAQLRPKLPRQYQKPCLRVFLHLQEGKSIAPGYQGANRKECYGDDLSHIKTPVVFPLK